MDTIRKSNKLRTCVHFIFLLTTIFFTTPHPLNACWTCCSAPEPDEFALANNFRWIDRGVLAGMGKPSSHEDIEELARRNVGLIVTLMADEVIEGDFISGALDSELTSGLNIATLHLPIPANNPPTLDQVDTFLETLEAARARGKATVVHCEYGISRTGTMIACWLIAKKHYSIKKALKTIRKGIEQVGRILSEDQQTFVENYYQHLHNASFVMPLTSLHGSRTLFDDDAADVLSAARPNRKTIEEGERAPFELGALPPFGQLPKTS